MLNQQNHNKKYTLADIEKYLAGNMSYLEMHEFEKAALQDPFLAHAIEGYKIVPLHTAKKDLKVLNQQILSSNRKKKVKSFVYKFWFKAAASVVSFACIYSICGLVFDQEQNVSKTAVIEQQVLPPSSIINNNPEIKPTIEEVHTTIPKQKVQDISLKNNKSTPIENGDVSYSKGKKTPLQQASTSRGFELDKSINKDEPKGSIKPEEIEKLNTDDYKTENKKNDEFERDKEEKTTLDSKTGQLRESTYGSITQQKETAYELQKKKGLYNIEAKPATQAYPEGGWQAFNSYVYNTLQSMGTGRAKDGIVLGTIKVEKQVEAEFYINAQGNPYNIHILQSSGNKNYDNNIISIIKKGPKWIRFDQSKKTSVKIKL